jgi:hypothetical protein
MSAPARAFAVLVVGIAAIAGLAPGAAAAEDVEGGAVVANALTAAEKREGWKLLFDGKSLRHWRGYKMRKLPAGWSVRDGAIRFDPPDEGARADIITRKQYDDFDLRIEWAVGAGGNSGIFFRVSEDRARTYETGAEFQVLDNKGHRDGEKPETSAGSNYALHAPVQDVTRPLGEWNQARIRVEGAHVTHWLNGAKLLEYDLWSPEWKALVAASKFAKMPGYGLNHEGHLALQDHGDPVRFRNVKIRAL